jgi:hypothetical protein
MHKLKGIFLHQDLFSLALYLLSSHDKLKLIVKGSIATQLFRKSNSFVSLHDLYFFFNGISHDLHIQRIILKYDMYSII